MPNHLESIPDEFKQACAGFLLDAYTATSKACSADFGFPPPGAWSDDEEFLSYLYASPLAARLAGLAQVAGGMANRNDTEFWQYIHDTLNSILGATFLPPGAETGIYWVPEDYWHTGIGQMFALATIWLEGEQLITMTEAARLQGVSLSTMASRVHRGNVPVIFDPRAKNPQKGGRLLNRKDIPIVQK